MASTGTEVSGSSNDDRPRLQEPSTCSVNRPSIQARQSAPQRISAPARVSGVVFHGRTLRLHAELGEGTAIIIDAPRRADGSQFSVGDVAHVSLRRGANCPMLSS